MSTYLVVVVCSLLFSYYFYIYMLSMMSCNLFIFSLLTFSFSSSCSSYLLIYFSLFYLTNNSSSSMSMLMSLIYYISCYNPFIIWMYSPMYPFNLLTYAFRSYTLVSCMCSIYACSFTTDSYFTCLLCSYSSEDIFLPNSYTISLDFLNSSYSLALYSFTDTIYADNLMLFNLIYFSYSVPICLFSCAFTISSYNPFS